MRRGGQSLERFRCVFVCLGGFVNDDRIEC
jgi:hypothetical protein